jgi:hypothetical protein
MYSEQLGVSAQKDWPCRSRAMRPWSGDSVLWYHRITWTSARRTVARSGGAALTTAVAPLLVGRR